MAYRKKRRSFKRRGRAGRRRTFKKTKRTLRQRIGYRM
jgi:hypothetical protein